MKPDTIKTGAMPATARDSARTEAEAMAASGNRWNTPSLWNGHPAPLAGDGRGSFARREDAGGAWRFSSAVQSSPVGTVTSWRMSASGKRMMIVQ